MTIQVPVNAFVVYHHDDREPEIVPAEFSNFSEIYEELSLACLVDQIRSFTAPRHMEACLHLKSLDDTIWLHGTPHLECHL